MARTPNVPSLVSVVNDPNLLTKLAVAGAKFVELVGKAPKAKSWNDGKHCVKPTTKHNLGLLHSASGTMSLDVDDYVRSKHALKLMGMDLDVILAQGWQIFSPKPNRRKAIFAAPPDDGDQRVRAFSGYDDTDRTVTLLELREGAVQDFIWGIHPDTQTALAHAPFNGFPLCPEELIALRGIYDQPEGNGRRNFALIAGLKPIAYGSSAEPGRLRYPSDNRDSFNRRADPGRLLQGAGYIKVDRGRHAGRWIRNGSSTGVPGIWRVDGKDDLFICKHAGDPLEGLFDPWTIHVVYQHAGDVTSADAAEEARRKQERAEALKLRTVADERLKKETGLGTEYTARELFDTKIKPINWIVQGLLPPGLTVLAAPAKAGKSYLVLQLAAAVAGGRSFLGCPVRNGPVLYYDLESSPRIQKKRLEPIIKAHDVSMLTMGSNLKFRLDSARGTECAEDIREYMESRADIALVIVDVFAKVRDDDGAAARKGVYQADYAVFEEFRHLCDDYPELCLVFVHHTNKGNYENAFDAISGSMAIQGVTNTNWVLQHIPMQGINDSETKEKLKRHLKFSAAGKEIEQHDLVIRHMHDFGGWELSDLRPEEIKLTAKRKEIFDLFEGDYERVLTSDEIHKELGGNINTLRNTLHQMVKAGQLESTGKGPGSGYRLPPPRERKY